MTQLLSDGRKFHIGINIKHELPQFEMLYYPLLLQRAIEGINKNNENDDYCYIDMQSDCIEYSIGVNNQWRCGERGATHIFYSDFENNDKAKEFVLNKFYENKI